jgi:hypothetical protein
VLAETSTDPRSCPPRTTLHVRVPGRYRADVALPAAVDANAVDGVPARLNRARGRITFTLPVAA